MNRSPRDTKPVTLPFVPETLHPASHAKLRPLGSQSTLAQWRFFAIGPCYFRPTHHVLYLGWDLNAFLGFEQPGKRPTQHFEPARLYRISDEELRVLGTIKTFYAWRGSRSGPDSIKVGGRILYHGDALNRFLESSRVQTDHDVTRPPEVHVPTINPGLQPYFT